MENILCVTIEGESLSFLERLLFSFVFKKLRFEKMHDALMVQGSISANMLQEKDHRSRFTRIK
ncbi:MAG: hypothetical protein ACR5K4_01645 [Sodalis sp. (in: enterobacteria)]